MLGGAYPQISAGISSTIVATQNDGTESARIAMNRTPISRAEFL